MRATSATRRRRRTRVGDSARRWCSPSRRSTRSHGRPRARQGACRPGRSRSFRRTGWGALPWREIVATQQAGGVVRVATDHDRAGERLWRELSDRYPSEVTFGRLVREQPALKDWNDDLRFPAQAEEVRERERTEARRQEAERRAQEREADRQRTQERQRDRGRDRGGWDHDR